jgi:hypothetical protein
MFSKLIPLIAFVVAVNAAGHAKSNAEIVAELESLTDECVALLSVRQPMLHVGTNLPPNYVYAHVRQRPCFLEFFFWSAHRQE